MIDSPSDYTATAWGGTHHYSLADGQLGYRWGGSDILYSIELLPGRFSVRQRWQTHPKLRGGLGFIASLFLGLGLSYATKGRINNPGTVLCVILAGLGIGLYLIVRFRRIYRVHVLRTSSGDELLIYHDPANIEQAEAFTSRLEAMASGGTGA